MLSHFSRVQLFVSLCTCSPPGSTVYGISQARILEWVAIPSSRGSSQHKDRNWVICISCLAGRFFTAELLGKPSTCLLLLCSCLVMSGSLQLHGQQRARPPCPPPSSRFCSSFYPPSLWCHPTVLSSAAPFSSSLQSFWPSRSFKMSWLFASGEQSTGVSASAPVLPMNTESWSPLWLTGLISLQFKGFSRVFSNTTVQRYQFLGAHPSFWSNFHIRTWLVEKP